MKIKALALTLFVAGVAASFALASPGHGHGKPGSTTTTSSTTGTTATTTTTTESHGKGQAKGCKPEVAFVLNGTFVSASGTSLTMKVTHANHHAKGLGSPATLGTDGSTVLRRDGKLAKLTDFSAGDRLNVQARGCKSAAGGAQLALVAKRVTGHSASSGEDGGTTTTGTTTSSTPPTTTSSGSATKG